ncbi:MAG: hypothetical protein PW788_13225 [Micavibrio sp.]|nr:hypothetical protein [Micavibrio sp.]
MVTPVPPKRLKMAQVFNDYSGVDERYAGYQKVDDQSVLYRRYLQLDGSRKPGLLQVFDFSTFQMTTLFEGKGGSSGEYAVAMQITPFSQIENSQSIRDAHQALTDLGGSPPALDTVLNFGMKLEKDVSVRNGPVKFRDPGLNG